MSMKIVIGSTFKGALILEKRVDCITDWGSPTFNCRCVCGTTFVKSSRNLKRSKVNDCPACKKSRTRELISKARDNKIPYVAPEFKDCNSCFAPKPYGEFPKGRNTCTVCHNVGRSAYYHNNLPY